MDTSNMPSFPKEQLAAIVMWVASQAVAFGLIKHAPSQQTLSGAATVVATLWVYASAHLRGRRAIAVATVHAANAAANSNSTPNTDQPAEPIPLVTPPVTSMV